MRSCPGSQLSRTNRDQDSHPCWKCWLILGRRAGAPCAQAWWVGLRGPLWAVPASGPMLWPPILEFPVLKGFARAKWQQPMYFV